MRSTDVCVGAVLVCGAAFALGHAGISRAQSQIAMMNMSVAIHTAAAVFLDPTEMIAEATARLQQNDGLCEDVKCCIGFTNTTPGATFGTPIDGYEEILSDSDKDYVFGNFPAWNVKVVKVMQNCCGGIGAVAGCTVDRSRVDDGNQNTIIRSDSYSPIYAHEFGHAQGVNHYSSSCTDRIMRLPTSSIANAVTSGECSTMRATPSYLGAFCSGPIPSQIESYFVPQAGSSLSPIEGAAALQYFRACPNNDQGASLPNGVRIKVVLKDSSGQPMVGIAAADIGALFNGGTPAQLFSGLGADSVIANSMWNYSPLCPDVRMLNPADPSDGNGIAYIYLTGANGQRYAYWKWGHYDSRIPVYAAGVSIEGRLTSSAPPGTYELIIKNFDLTGGLTAAFNQGETVSLADYNAVSFGQGQNNALSFWRDLNWNGAVDLGDLNILLPHLGHDCDTPNYP